MGERIEESAGNNLKNYMLERKNFWEALQGAEAGGGAEKIRTSHPDARREWTRSLKN